MLRRALFSAIIVSYQVYFGGFMKSSTKVLSILLLIALLFSSTGCRSEVISLDDIPDYSDKPYVQINGNEPFFEESEITDEAYESYSELDALGRCGVAMACLGLELAPTEEREDIGSVYPSGWEYSGSSNNREYDFGYLYNRCHLIGYQLAGENANEKNLITGTRYMNVEGMLPFENMVDDYIEDTQNHVMYRVTPIYDGYNYLADGVLMEALSVEDEGEGIEFCIFVYNVQPGIEINYFTGQNRKVGDTSTSINPDDITDSQGGDGAVTFIINKNSKKFHLPDASCVNNMKEENKESSGKTRQDLIDDGYDPCKTCNP